MKKYISIVLILALIFIGCNDLLDKEPYGSFSASSFYKTESEAVMAVNSIYDQLQNGNVYSTFGLMIRNVWSDDAEKGGGGPGDTPQLEEFNSFQILLSNSLVDGTWNAMYAGIFRANTVIEKVGGMTDFNLKNRLLGEAKFLRALYYFNLVTHFNGVPLVTSTDVSQLKTITRSPAQDIWSMIETDLLDAINSLPLAYDASDVGRATKGSAQGLLGRTYLFTKQWQKAADVYSEVINSNTYQLMDDYSVNFLDKEGDNLPESVFEVQFASGTGSTSNSFEYHGWVRPRDVPSIGWGGNGFVLPTQSLADAFEPEDSRRKATLLNDGDEAFGTTYSSSWSPTGHNTRKYIYGPEVIHQEADANFKVIRYSEILLGYAEAISNGANGKANITGLEALNKVRRRAGLDDIATLSFNSIVQERRVEFALEAVRFFDLVRWDIAKDVLGPNFDVNHDEYMPIPLNEILLNPNLEQNPGY
ncbi:RagB/SusD family nutrient uptake outer membrane protein [Dysgonomonas sp. Marseille-P4677]|uniref:RagB/SusD family nutrient uptake outer membrane protein n=1 Tax=Dysgonomonas sp. Marseille-P4677 TaxID=2364790 RepID=UPI0019142590|nr:RagB/SusD family nutrient uptake outer membrane protein [Dysgonomonas sp. Marseille-P4677]MBK5721877.1 RagB/SusD family nutrient uptake outer membrane protein [Dysgonomonas sp. Marseille-P4677]